MDIEKRLVVLVGISIIFAIEGLSLLIGILAQSIWICVVAWGSIAFSLYFFYVRLVQKREARYPLAPPEGKADIYFPRTDIPRPIHADFRNMREKKKRLEKLKKKMRSKKK